ncbi:MAG: MerR family transcriptional regulator [candidate division NC10 bacterium]|nr:MerR family transcriptional regulator [candidate division NC10 bacterium]
MKGLKGNAPGFLIRGETLKSDIREGSRKVDPVVPEKLFYKIGEVSRITGVEPYILRYWESEFEVLEPQKSKTGQRHYRKGDIELILKVKRLLYEEGYTIAGARRRLIAEGKRREAPSKLINREGVIAFQTLKKVREGLESIFNILNQK